MSATAPHTNAVVLRGTITAEPVHRELASGTVVVQFDVTTRIACPATGAHPKRAGGDEGTATNVSVPVAWTDPAAADVAALRPGEDVVVVGTVRRRFFRAGGLTQSRTEVVPERVVPARRAKSAAAAVAAALARLA